MIPESQIDQAIDFVSSNFEVATKEFADYYPELVQYLFSGKFDLFTNEENELLLFIFIVVSHCTSEDDRDGFLLENFEKYEESNWDLFENDKSLSWKEKLDICFKDYDQEDLLAMVEDLLEEDEDPILTNIGKEFIFVTAKSFIDNF